MKKIATDEPFKMKQGKLLPLRAVDLGVMQTEVENSTKDLKRKTAAFKKAKEEFAAAQQRYEQAEKALASGFETVIGSNKMPL